MTNEDGRPRRKQYSQMEAFQHVQAISAQMYYTVSRVQLLLLSFQAFLGQIALPEALSLA